MKNKAKRIKLGIGLFVLWFLIHIAYTCKDGLSDKMQKADIAVILANKVNEDGTLSAGLENRVNCGLALYQSGRVKKLVMSGAFGKEGYYEGTKMKEYLVQKGVPDSVILVDNHGDNTRLTVKNMLHLRDSLHFTSIIAVSQYYHLTRTKMLFHQNGFEAVSGASPRYFQWRDSYALFREFVAYYWELFF